MYKVSHFAIFNLVGCIEDLRRFSDISAYCDLKDLSTRSGETGDCTPDLLIRKPRA